MMRRDVSILRQCSFYFCLCLVCILVGDKNFSYNNEWVYLNESVSSLISICGEIRS